MSSIESAGALTAAALIKVFVVVCTLATVSETPASALRYRASDLSDLYQNNRAIGERSTVASPIGVPAVQPPISTPGPTPSSTQDEIQTWLPEKLKSTATRLFGQRVGSAMGVLAFLVFLMWQSVKGWKDINDMWLWVMQRLGRAPPEGTATLSETDDLIGLRVLREKVKCAWIQGVLEESFSSRPRIQLDKEIVPDEVERPLDAMARLSPPTSRMCPPATTLLKLFDDSGLSLLILGEPGAGKTTALLTLASGLLDRAETDATQPVPVVLRLSSWRLGRNDLFSWLAEELGRQYQVSRRLAASWLMRNRLLLLLDGLDEVASASQSACLAAINEFTTKTGIAGIAVCSRSEEYRALAARAKLKLNAAVRLHSLTEAKVEQYLDAAGDAGLSGLRELLKEDSVLSELSKNPLMLAVMTRAYEQLSAEALNRGDLDTPEKRRDNIFGTYVERLMHGNGLAPYTEESTLSFLAWLAERLKEHSVSVFFIEQLQPTWLDGWPSQWAYLLLSRLLGSASIMVLLEVFLVMLKPGEVTAARQSLGEAIGAALAMGLGVGLVDASIAMIRRARTDSGLVRWVAWMSLRLVGYMVVIFLLAVFVLEGQLRGNSSDDVFVAVTIGALLWAIRNSNRTLTNDIQTTESVKLSLRGALRGSLRGALYAFVPVGVFVAITHLWISGKLLRPRVSDLIFLGSLGLTFGGTLGAFKTGIRETKNRPNEGILLSVRNVLFMTLALSAAATALAYMWDFWEGAAFRSDVLACLLVGPIGGLTYAGLDILEHYSLRLILYLRRRTPLRYSNFLDYVARLTFLRKVGGGYIFLHPLLADYFATHPRSQPLTVFVRPAEPTAAAESKAIPSAS